MLQNGASTDIPEIEYEAHYAAEMVQVMVMHLYGFDFMDNNETHTPTSLKDFLDICAAAADYEIGDLWVSALEAGCRALTDCLSDEDDENIDHALKEFFLADLSWMAVDKDYGPLRLTVFWENLIQLYTKSVLQKLLDDEPTVARHLLDQLVKEKMHRDLQDKKPKEIRCLLDELVKAKTLKSLLDEEPKVVRCLLDELVKKKVLLESS